MDMYSVYIYLEVGIYMYIRTYIRDIFLCIICMWYFSLYRVPVLSPFKMADHVLPSEFDLLN